MRLRRAAGLLAATLGLAAGGTPAGPGFQLSDIAAEAGVTAVTVCGVPGKPTILDGTGPGLAWLDYDGDGLLDLFLRNGGTTGEPEPVHPADVLYRGLGNGRYEDVTERAGVGDRHFGSGVVAADTDGDGDVDLFLSNFGRNSYYRNRGDGTFEDATEASGLAAGGWSTGAALFDADADGDLDLFVAGYVIYDAQTTPRLGNPRCIFMGVEVFCGPRGLPPAQDRFYLNRGDGTFLEASREAGFHRDEPYYGLGAVAGDVDGDGDPDVYVANDATPNLLYLNDGSGHFSEEALLRGVAFSQEGVEQAGMGTDLGDYDGDGRVDIIVTNFSHDTHALYHNGGLLFEMTTLEAGLGPATLPRLGWGVAFVDLDGDGRDDLFVSNGHVYPQMDGRGLGTAFRQTNQVFRNLGGGTFRDVSSEAGPGMEVLQSSRGAAIGDLEGDGDPDIAVWNMDAAPTLLRNDRDASWLGVVAHGRAPNRSGIGARIELRRDAGGPEALADRRVSREVRAGGSYLSQHDLRQLFGLGPPVAAGESGTTGGAEIEVRWRDGERLRLRGLAAGRYHHLFQGDGAAPAPRP